MVDLVADVCVHTPTAAAEMVVPSLSDMYAQHRQRVNALHEAVLDYGKMAENKLQGWKNRLRRLRLDRQVQQDVAKLTWKRQQLVHIQME